MRILLLTQFYWPEMRTAPFNLAAMAADLQAKGHELLVITGFPNHPLGRIYDGYKVKLWQWDEVQGVRVLRLPLFPDHSVSKVRRLINYTSFVFAANTLGIFFSRDFQPDVIFAYYAPLTMGVIAGFFRRILHVPVVYWITDLWPENLRASGVSFSDRIFQSIYSFEAWGYRQAEAICVDSPGYEKNLVSKNVPPRKLYVIPEWADEELFFPSEPDLDLARQHGLDNRFNIVYGGNLGGMQHLSTVIEAARLLQDISDLQFVLIGDGNDEENLRKQVVELRLLNVKFIERQPIEEMHKFFALADALLVHLKREPIFELQLPSKTIAYLASGRPIICAMAGAAWTVVSDAGAGVFARPEDPESLVLAVRTLYSMPSDVRQSLGDAGRSAYLSAYTRSEMVARIEKVLMAVSTNHQEGRS